MDCMKNWLGPTIEQQLDRVLRWKIQGLAGFLSPDKVPYEDDGSNLRVRLQKVNSLQILKFEAFQEPIKAVLSDSYNSIQATFASSVVEAYVSKHRTRITKDTQGGVIAISQYEIVATHLGPKQSSVTLLVRDFHFCGCAGQATFGQPVPIQQRQRVELLVRQLRDLKSAETLDTRKHSDEDELASPSSKRPQTKTCIVGDASHRDDRHLTLATQVGFHSQISEHEELGLTIADKAQPNDNLSRSSKEAGTALNRYGSSTSASRRTKTRNEDLLRLLTAPRKPETLESPANGNTRESTKDELVTDKPLLEYPEKHGRAADHSDSGQHSSPRRSVPQATSSKKMLVEIHGGASESLRQEESGVDDDSTLGESICRTRQNSNSVKQRDSRMAPDRKVPAVEKHEVHTKSARDFTKGLRSEDNTGELATNDPWNGITRIRRRDARISKEQQKLLDNDNSWYPPQPGRRAPVANVPIAILQALNAAAERCDENTEPAEEQQDVLELDVTGSQQVSSNTGSETGQDSDEERLSGWSSSSLPSASEDQLPPDSSFESSILPDRVSRKPLQPNPTAVDEEEKAMSSPIARPVQVQSGCAGSGGAVQVVRLEFSDASRSNNGLPSQTPTAQAEPFVGQDNADSTQSFGSAPDPENVLGEDPIRAHTDNTSELADTVKGQINERDLDRESSERYPQVLTTAESAGAARSHSQDPKVHSQIRRSHSRDPSSDDDDLESKIPQALGAENENSGQEQVYDLVSPPLLPPSTAFHKEEPTLQVKHTPYHPKQTPGVSPCINTSPALLMDQDRSKLDSIGDGLTADYSTLTEVVVPGTHGLHSDTNIAGSSPSRVRVDGTVDDLLKYDGEVVKSQQRNLETDTRAHEGSNKSPFRSTSSGWGVPGVESNHPRDPLPYLSVVNERMHEKRKLADMDQLSPFVTKRRKRLKAPSALKFSQENRQTQDPSLIARQHRREFLASRKSKILTNAADDLGDVAFQKTDQDAATTQDAAQRTTSPPEESTPMELDGWPPDTSTHVTAFESVGLGGNTALSGWKPPSVDHTPRNKSVELGDYLNFSRERSNKASGPTAVPQSSSTMASPSSPALPTKGSVYNTFKSTYPAYSGGFEHFSGMCQRIHGLLQAERMEHRSLWDDFVIRHRTDYRDYLLDCTDRGDDPIPYELFYKHHIDEPIHHKHVMTPATLNDVITSVEDTGAPQPKRRLRSPAKALHNGPAIAKASRHEPCSPSKAREVVDLTLAGPALRPTSAMDHPSKLGRTLSWTEPAKPGIDSPAFGNNFQTPRPALTRDSTTPLRTLTRVIRGPTQTSKQPTPVQIGKIPVPSHPVGHPVATADNVPDMQKSPSPLETSDSNRSTVVEWLGHSSSDTESPSIPESPRPAREETEEDRWWRDRNTPFKAFTRAYASLKSVQGRMGTVDEEGILRPSLRQLDVLSWKL